jgi:hypothetical protein
MHFYESITTKKKILLMRMNDDIPHCLGQLVYEYYIILSNNITNNKKKYMILNKSIKIKQLIRTRN